MPPPMRGDETYHVAEALDQHLVRDAASASAEEADHLRVVDA